MRRFNRIFWALPLVWIGTARAEVHNPILDHPDPFITYHLIDGKRLLLATTGSNITIWYGPSIPLAATNSKVVYAPADGMIDMMSPTIWSIDGHWWIYFAGRYPNTPQGIYALRSDTDDPLGSYSFRGNVKLGHPSIDPSLLLLGGKMFLMTASVDGGENAVRMVQLAHPMEPVGPDALITQPTQPWELGAMPNHYPVAEGPTALYHAGKTFIVYSASNTKSAHYCMGLLSYTGGDPLRAGSWTKSGPVFQSDPAHGIFSPGRGSFAESVDHKYWMLYHAKASDAVTMAGRSTRAQTFTWNADGTPDFGRPRSDSSVAETD